MALLGALARALSYRNPIRLGAIVIGLLRRQQQTGVVVQHRVCVWVWLLLLLS